MRPLRHLLLFVLPVLLVWGMVSSLAAQSSKPQPRSTPDTQPYPLDWVQQFVPDSRSFWEASINWTSNFGPAFRDTVLTPTQFLGCSTQFALCFHSGAEPYPCTLSADGQSANCLCTVATEVNYTLIDAILNYDVYTATVQRCNADGSGCPNTGDAPVCSYLQSQTLMPGGNVFSTYDTESRQEILKALAMKNAGVTQCKDEPYAGCMTAPCLLNSDGTANCKCPVFYGDFELTGRHAQCTLGHNLVPSASYIPSIDIYKNIPRDNVDRRR